MLMSWDEAAEMLNLCHKKEKKTFNPNLPSESLAGCKSWSARMTPGYWWDLYIPPEHFTWVNLICSIKASPLALGC